MNISNNRLLEVFNENSQDFYKNAENKDQKSKHWKTRYRIKKFSIENLINFRSSDLSAGLDDVAVQTDVLSSRVYAELVNQLSEEYVLSNLLIKNIGNCEASIKYKNIFLDYNKLIHIHWFNDVEKSILKNNKISNFDQLICLRQT